MDLMQAFNEVCGDFPQFRAQIAKARDVTRDAGVRAQLDRVLATMDQSFAEFKETFPRAAEDVQQRLASAESRAKQASAALEAVEQQRAQAEAAIQATAAAAAAAAVPAVTPPQPLDPRLGGQLRQELLERFAGWRRLADGNVHVDREIWEDWEEN